MYRDSGRPRLGVPAYLAVLVVAGTLGGYGAAQVVAELGAAIESQIGVDWSPRPPAAALQKAAVAIVPAEPERMSGAPEPAIHVAPRAPIVQTVGAASDSGKRFYSGDGDTFRTVCVRLCDGYFWTVSFSATDEHFERDNARCQAGCGVPAKLYKYPNPGGRPEDMEALDGQRYSKLRTAFQFRQRYDAACRCGPDPWTAEAQARRRLDLMAAIPPRKTDAVALAEKERLESAVETASKARMQAGVDTLKAIAVAVPPRVSVASAGTGSRSTLDKRRAGKDRDGTDADSGGDSRRQRTRKGEETARQRQALAGSAMRLGGPGTASDRTGRRAVATRSGGEWRQKVFDRGFGN